ncbi:MAG: type I-F CRISPR-associated protein Csy1 [Hyphomonadaceae bacterium]|nr:type I-F CRISPR-associated protein Csy1 [Hyphomonadaceae bacterium]
MSKALPGNFRRIRLELAREPEHPEGDSGIGYTLLAPLRPDGHLDIDSARYFGELCKVVRFRRGEESEEGYLRRRPGGSWAFHYDFDGGTEDDDPAFRLERHRFNVGDYVTIMEDEGAHTYRVVSVQPV